MEYTILRATQEENPKEAYGMNNLINFVNEYLNKGWEPQGGISISKINLPQSKSAEKTNECTCFAQAMIKK